MSLNFPSQAFSPQTNAALSPEYSKYYEGGVRERILIVDDEETVRSLFAACLSARYDCAEAASTKEALAALAESDFALVITDMIMPGLSGVELLRKIIEIYPYTAVIMVSGINQPQRALDAVRLGAFDYLIKPCDLDVLEITVERALERRALMRNARQYKLDLEARNSELASGKAELERLQAQIIHSEKMASLGQLAAGIAHELNNPVGFIYGNMDVLNDCIGSLTRLLAFYDKAELPESISADAARLKDEIDYEGTLEDLSSIVTDCRDGAQRIRDIVQNLRTFSRLDEAEFKKTDVHEGIDSTVRLLSRYYSSDNITLVRNYDALPPIDAFSGQLNQVWMNLLVNAAQAVGGKEGGGEVSITTTAFEDTVAVAIKDTGGGISPEHLNRIFEPFYTTKSVGEGTGLGLSISFGIVERHGGSIKVDSEINKGTTFSVTLPINIKSGENGEPENF
ncbi:MAG: response regulator [Acidobacteria bacterium]|jgi:signal transduction histidine kinase|nr:response regulator [Acidobacteriota bacterium]